MGVGKMNKSTEMQSVGKMSKNKFGVGKMYSENNADDKKMGLKATEDLEKAMASKK